MLVKIRYNGRRFPRIVNLSGRQGTLSFLEDLKELVMNSYDANLLLLSNTRLQPNLWEFDVIDIIKENDQNDTPEAETEIKKTAKRGRPKKGE